MKQPLILLCAIILIFALSCSKTEPPPPELPPGVAMVAWDENTEEDLAGYIVHLSSDQIYIDGLKELRMVGDRVVNYSVSVFDDNGVEQIIIQDGVPQDTMYQRIQVDTASYRFAWPDSMGLCAAVQAFDSSGNVSRFSEVVCARSAVYTNAH